MSDNINRYAYYYKLSSIASKQSTYNELLQFVNEKKDIVNLYDFQKLVIENICYDNLHVDINSTILYPDDVKAGTPLSSTEDGNCLYNSISILLTGTERLSRELRIKTIFELILNRQSYNDSTFSKYASSDVNSFEEEMINSIKNGTYSGLREISALSTVLETEIFSIYPMIQNPCVCRDDLNTIFYPKRSQTSNRQLIIMWTHTSNTNLVGWCPNHFVPVVQHHSISQTISEHEEYTSDTYEDNIPPIIEDFDLYNGSQDTLVDFNFEKPDANSIFSVIILNPTKYEQSKPMKGVRKSFMYTIRETDITNLTADDNGAYINSRTTKSVYEVKRNIDGKLLTRTVYKSSPNSYYYNQRIGSSNYKKVNIGNENVYELDRYYRVNKTIKSLKRTICRVKSMETSNYQDFACVIYHNSEENRTDVPVLPHGNSNGDTPYIATSKQTLRREDEILIETETYGKAYDKVLEESGGPLKSSSQSQEPRNIKQLYNRKQKLTEKKKTTYTKDKIEQVILEQRKNDFITSVIVQKDAYYFFISSKEQLCDMKNFCCLGNDVSVLCIDTTFNLCDLWVTDTSYRNKRIVSKDSEKHPVFLGPILFHFTKNYETFLRFALEILAAEPELISLRKIGADMDEAITKGFKTVFKQSNELLCVRHIKQRDEMKLDKLFASTKSSGAEKKRSKSSILTDIYGSLKGQTYELGLAEATSEVDFKVKLLSLEEKWESLCPGFYQWFLKKRFQKFVNSVICSAREGTSVAGLFYQNDIESKHYQEKLEQCFKKVSIVEVIEHLSALMKRQNNLEIQAVYGGGNYKLSKEYSKFSVDSARWHQWSEDRRMQHMETIRNYVPTKSDSFKMPQNCGRKPGYSVKHKSEEPDLLFDRFEDLTPASASSQKETKEKNEKLPVENNIRFSDPRAQPIKKFELFRRTQIPRAVKKCQGLCGKTIEQDESLVVKSFGTSRWTDKKTGEEKSKFGPMYIHFNEHCLRNFDSENYYGPGTSFDYQRIEMSSETKSALHKEEIDFLLDLGVTDRH